MTDSATDAPFLCDVAGVWHQFTQPNGKPFTALQDITLGIRRREVIALLGPSGCGKSTLLRILAGLITPTRGKVHYHGKPFTGINPGMALVFQSFALFPWMTVADNIRVVLTAAGLAEDDIAARTARSIKRVGLTGFSGAYPRELSGGMKQRVGVARAIALDPEIMFLDEPFCHVDALTAETLRAEILDLWAAPGGNPSSVLLVSHDIPEVVGMADRIVLLGANPGRVMQIVDNPLPRPRDLRSPEAKALIDRLHDLITGHELPDAAPVTVAEPAGLAPIPAVRAIQVLGLLEMLDARGGTDDLFRLADETGHEYGIIIQAAKAAELLGCVTTPKREVTLTDVGRVLVRSAAAHRPALWRERLLQVRLISTVVELVRQSGPNGLPREEILDMLLVALPDEDYEAMFATLIGWARIGELLTYDEHRQVVALAVPSAQPAPTYLDLGPYLTATRIITLPGQPTKAEVLTALTTLMAGHSAIGDQAALIEAVKRRETSLSTGLGHRVALPHAQLNSIREIVLSLALIPEGCDYGAVDGQTVQIAVLIAAPAQDRPGYLRILADLATRLNQVSVREALVQAPTAEAALALLRGV